MKSCQYEMASPIDPIDTHLMLPYTQWSFYKQRIGYGKFGKQEEAGATYY
jgi:hypothetical protein